MFNWLNIELTNRCNKSCSFCGRAKKRKAGVLDLGDMDFELYKDIIAQIEPETIIQFHKNGEPLLYEKIGDAINLAYSKNMIINIVTNGILLMDRIKELKQATTICVSVIEDDIKQFETIKEFIAHTDVPVFIKFLGNYYNPEYEKLGLKCLRRKIHHPDHDYNYQDIYCKPESYISEIGICLDFLNKPSVSWNGDFCICNRFDYDGLGVLGNLNDFTIKELWTSNKRYLWLMCHKNNRRDLVPLCKTCQYWGNPQVV